MGARQGEMGENEEIDGSEGNTLHKTKPSNRPIETIGKKKGRRNQEKLQSKYVKSKTLIVGRGSDTIKSEEHSEKTNHSKINNNRGEE